MTGDLLIEGGLDRRCGRLVEQLHPLALAEVQVGNLLLGEWRGSRVADYHQLVGVDPRGQQQLAEGDDVKSLLHDCLLRK
jgi:hypothetical protein